MLRNFIILSCLFAPGLLSAQTELDSIIAVVDERVITARELSNQIELVEADFAQGNRALPETTVLRRQVLEALISDSLLLQESQRRGILVTDSQLNQTMQRIARSNQLSLSAFREELISQGINYDEYRGSIRREMIINILRRQYSQRNTNLSDLEVDDYIKRSGEDSTRFEYRLSHILIAVADAASPEQVDRAKSIAQEILSKLDQGEPFDTLANTFSSGGSALQGGDLGWRKQAELPSLFSKQVLKMKAKDHAGPIRSASGFHIVYLADLRDQQQTLVAQTRSRHILIKPNELVSEEDAQGQLAEYRQRIIAGEDFAKFARLYSVDYASGADGGDLGWHQPGAMVKEYESVADQLEIGTLSDPFRSQFGWHLMEVTDRRTVDETEQSKREKISAQLLQQKQREVFDLWKRRLRDEAYIVFNNE